MLSTPVVTQFVREDGQATWGGLQALYLREVDYPVVAEHVGLFEGLSRSGVCAVPVHQGNSVLPSARYQRLSDCLQSVTLLVLWGVDADIARDMVTVFVMIARLQSYPDRLGYGDLFLEVVKQWRPSQAESAND